MKSAIEASFVVGATVILLVALLAGAMMTMHILSGSGGSMMSGGMGHHAGGGMGHMTDAMGTMHGWINDSPDRATGTVSPDPTQQNDTSAPDTDASGSHFELTTAYASGLAYRGLSGSIDGTVNPTLRVTAGETVTMRLRNRAGGRHDLAIPEWEVRSRVLQDRGETSAFQFVPDAPGKYTYYCSIPGHRRAGMEGILIVSPRPDGEDSP